MLFLQPTSSRLAWQNADILRDVSGPLSERLSDYLRLLWHGWGVVVAVVIGEVVTFLSFVIDHLVPRTFLARMYLDHLPGWTVWQYAFVALLILVIAILEGGHRALREDSANVAELNADRDRLRAILDAESNDPPVLEMADNLVIDTATPNHAAYLRLRFWNRGGGTVSPEVRVTKVVLEDGTDAKFSAQLPLVLGWSSLKAAPALTRQHTAGETVGVVGILGEQPTPTGNSVLLTPPLLYIAGAEHHAEIGQTTAKVFFCVQAIAPTYKGVEPIERWFAIQVVDEGSRRYEVRVESSPALPRSPIEPVDDSMTADSNNM